MESSLLPHQPRDAQEKNDSPRPATCPVCGGVLIPLGFMLRCGRCRYTACEGCEGGPGDQ